MRLALTLAATLIAAPALANVTADFIEGAPKDRFVITNRGDCALGATTVAIDFEGSAGALIFDTTGAGAGVEVFQPLEITAGGALLQAVPEVADGDRMVALDLTGLAPGARVAFTIDVDDTIGQREITVRGSEIAGAVFRLGDQSAPFGSDAKAAIAPEPCAG